MGRLGSTKITGTPHHFHSLFEVLNWSIIMFPTEVFSSCLRRSSPFHRLLKTSTSFRLQPLSSRNLFLYFGGNWQASCQRLNSWVFSWVLWLFCCRGRKKCIYRFFLYFLLEQRATTSKQTETIWSHSTQMSSSELFWCFVLCVAFSLTVCSLRFSVCEMKINLGSWLKLLISFNSCLHVRHILDCEKLNPFPWINPKVLLQQFN